MDLEQELLGLLLEAKYDDAFDEWQGKRLIERELNGAFGGLVSGEFFLEGGNAVGAGIEADVILEGREPNQRALQSECRDAIADSFCGTGGGFFDSAAHLLQTLLDICGKALDVSVNIRCCLLCCSLSCCILWHSSVFRLIGLNHRTIK